MVEVVTQRLAQPDAAGGYLLDGFPRTMAQAEALGAELAKQGARGKVDGVIVMDGPTEALVSRIAGRRTCESCQWSYHVTSRPPKVEGVCDRCGGTLIQRVDDAEATVRFRLQEYAAEDRAGARLLSRRTAGRCCPSTPSATSTRFSAGSIRRCC